MSELEEFLKRAAQKRLAKQQRQGVGPARPQPSRPPVAPVSAPRAVAPQPRAPVPPPAIPPVRTDHVTAEIIAEGVGEPLARHLDLSAFELRADKMGDSVEIADDLMDARIHAAFDHDVGGLQSPTVTVAKAPLPPMLAFLADANSLRQAFIISEIINRPEQRW